MPSILCSVVACESAATLSEKVVELLIKGKSYSFPRKLVFTRSGQTYIPVFLLKRAKLYVDWKSCKYFYYKKTRSKPDVEIERFVPQKVNIQFYEYSSDLTR